MERGKCAVKYWQEHGEETGAFYQGLNLSGFLPAPPGGRGLPLLFVALPQSRTEHWPLKGQLISSSFLLNAQGPVLLSPSRANRVGNCQEADSRPLLLSLLHCPGNNDITLRVGLRPPELHKQQWGHESTAGWYF